LPAGNREGNRDLTVMPRSGWGGDLAKSPTPLSNSAPLGVRHSDA
jgi:hypothetical protein